MKGFPKTINTRQDIDNLLVSHPEETEAYIAKLKEEVMVWVPVEMQELEDDTHKIVESEDLEGNAVRQQFELVENRDAKYFKLGFTL